MSTKLKVMTVIGTRPEAIKLAPVIKELDRRGDEVQSVVAVTAQHREMLDQVLSLFSIVPDYDLDIMRPGQNLFDVTQRALLGLRPVLEKEKPDFLIVQGDTTTVLVGALTAFYLGIPIGHVEAGLRTNDRRHPFPEEINRRLASVLADLHFAPTEVAKANLLREGIPEDRIYVTGNTVVDALLSVRRLALSPALSFEGSDEGKDYVFDHPVLSRIDFRRNRVVLVTAHRRENWGAPIWNICRAIRQIVASYPDVQVIFSVHPNPEVCDVVHRDLASVERVHLLEPLNYEPFVHLMDQAYLILTDSGGIQEEAPSLNKPVLVLRDVTERPEGVDVGTLKVVGTTVERIVTEAEELLSNPEAYARMAQCVNPYGDGRASQRIVEAILTRARALPRPPAEPSLQVEPPLP